MKILLTTLILLVSSVCSAQSRIPGYCEGGGRIGCDAPKIQVKAAKATTRSAPKATPVEISNVLDCGVTVEVGSSKNYGALNKLCSDVVAKYRTSFPEYHLPAKVNVPVSFLPSGVLVANFGRRVEGKKGVFVLDGFTDIDFSGKPVHFYVLSNAALPYIKTVFAHELFHVLNALSGHEDSEKGAADFTRSLGLGV
jgi:hypothetical protein